MDVVMGYLDTYVFDAIYNRAGALTATEPLARTSIVRQSLSLFVFIYSYIMAFYFGTAGLSYKLIYDKTQEKHPKFLPRQRFMEMACASRALPAITLMTIPWILGELHGHSLVYKEWDKYGYTYLGVSAAMFILFTDFCIYWIHRLEHHPLVYAKCHKLHHKWIPTHEIYDRSRRNSKTVQNAQARAIDDALPSLEGDAAASNKQKLQ
ncbi:c-5 sterol desaturase [Coemansia sp. RSA 2049]|nr:c-5 sterol desaturase [Coemansia sp. RSA 2049]